jgi:hypothetical protein
MRRAALAAALPLAVLAGCESMGRDDGLSASPMQHPSLEGFPLPNGFRLVPEHSVGSSAGQMRIVKYEFAGSTESQRVNRFYKDYMPAAGWTLKTEDFDRGVYHMRYESKTEECLVRITPDGSKSYIGVQLRPLPRGTAEREPTRALPPP